MGPNVGGNKIRKYTEPALSCGLCGCEFFEKITVNKFRTTPNDLQNGQKDLDAQHRVTLQRCVGCDAMSLPVLSYNFMSPVDREIAEELVEILTAKRKKNETNLSPEQT